MTISRIWLGMVCGIRPERELRGPPEVKRASPTRFLTDDEVLEILLLGDPCWFRVRIWRSKAQPSIVLVSQLPGGPSPSWATGRLANLIYRVHLGFTADGLRYFEDDIAIGQRMLSFVEFTPFGHGTRRLLVQSVRRPCSWVDLESVVGSIAR
jgi:hypothetical protein